MQCMYNVNFKNQSNGTERNILTESHLQKK